LIDQYDVRDKDVIDIGCGKGDFLVMICELGNNRGVGFDTSFEGTRVEHDLGEKITFIQDYYSDDYAEFAADLICCRYVFEHIYNPKEFLTSLRRTIGNRFETIVFFEVPNLQLIIRDLSVWDIIYEHYSYFSDVSLMNVFALCGFENSRVISTYNGQFLTIDAFPSKKLVQFDFNKREGLNEITDSIERFSENAKIKLSDWQDIYRKIKKESKRAVVWGAGAKGVSFLNVLNLQDQIEYIVDINPYKQGKYIGGSGQKIVAPDFLREEKPDVIIVMNSIYESEIRQMVRDLGLDPEYLCL
jgi:SAM-dependent methyltransferase